MRKLFLLGGTLCLLASVSSTAHASDYPRGNDWNRRNSGAQYWFQIRIDQDAREKEQARERRERDECRYYDNGKNYSHYRDKKQWKKRSRYCSEKYGHDHYDNDEYDNNHRGYNRYENN